MMLRSSTAKPLLIVPPAPTRWAGCTALLSELSDAWRDDLRLRIEQGVEHTQDALVVVPEGSQYLAVAYIRRHATIGVLGHLFTEPNHRGKGLARRLLQTLLSWFDMTGGRRLYATADLDLHTRFLEHFGFHNLHPQAGPATGKVPLIRALRGTDNPYANASGTESIRKLKRGDWPAIVAMQQHLAGWDPREKLEETALAAEQAAIELIAQQSAGKCHLLGAFRGKQLTGLGTIATDQRSDRTYAMIMPHDQPHTALRKSIIEFAKTQSYERVDFPMEALQQSPGDR